MSEFLLLFRGGYEATSQMSKEDLMRHQDKWKEWVRSIAQQGKLKGGQQLTEEGRVMTERGAKVTDGPFAETKEIVGGYLIVEVNDYDEAVAISMDCPIFETDGLVEVRRFKELSM